MIKSPRIMHIIDSLAIGGAERMLVDIVNNIDPERFRVSVCVTRSVCDLAKELHYDVPLKALHRKWAFDPQGLFRLKRFLQEYPADIIHAHGRSTFSFLVLAKYVGVIDQPIILHDHFGNIKIDKTVPFWFKYIASKHVDHYIGVCDELSEWAKTAGLNYSNISTIQNAVDFNRFDGETPIDIRSKLNIPQNKKIGVFIGNIRPAKGLDLLLAASLQFPKEKLPYFIIIGKELDSEYTKSCRELLSIGGIAGNFKFVGLQKNVVPWIKGSDFGVMPSRSESGPLVLIEYLACKRPFLAFTVGGISRLISQYIPDCFIQQIDPVEFAHGLERLMSTPQDVLVERADMNYLLAQKLFDMKYRVSDYIKIYDQITLTP